jgi:hypothetical protein
VDSHSPAFATIPKFVLRDSNLELLGIEILCYRDWLEQILCQLISALLANITSRLIPIGYIAVFFVISIDRLSGAREEYFEV